MPNFSGKWGLTEQLQAVAAGTWTGLPTYALYAWGRNTNGQLGLNDTVSRSSPVQVGALTNWAQVSLNLGQTVGYSRVAAIKTDGTLWSWGVNTGLSEGAIGDNTVVSKSSPVQIGSLANWSQVSAGYSHTASVKTDGTLWAWGSGNSGRLGDNTIVSKSSPIQVGALTVWSQVSAGGRFTSAIRTNGTLWSWGNNASGYLGINSIIATSSPVQVGALTNWYQVSAGQQHSVAVKTDGTLWSWGVGAGGRLGLNDTVYRSSPAQVGALTNWSVASAGVANTVAVKTDGTLWSWGSAGTGGMGAVGDNASINRSSPVQIGALTNWSKVSCGRYSSAATKTDGTLWVWGYNNNGQLGQNNTISRSSPVQVGALTNWYQPAAGTFFAAAIYQGTTN